MEKIKKGDVVGRISYGKDILFVVERIIKTKHGTEFAILKGLTVRIQADSPLEDLELIENARIEEHKRKFEKQLENRIKQCKNTLRTSNHFFRENTIIYTGKILHIDGDKKYSEKSNRYYKKLGLNAIVRNIPERRQAGNIKSLLIRYQPDILVVTRTWWHDTKRNKV